MEKVNLRAFNLDENVIERYINPNDFNLPAGYKIEVIAQGLDLPISMVFKNDDLIIAESGMVSGNPRVIRLRNDQFEVLAEYFNSQITGINYIEDNIYVSHKDAISSIMPDCTIRYIITGLPCNGDFGISNVAYGRLDRKIYFGLGTATNSGVVGPDNTWLAYYPTFHDYTGSFITLNGQNFSANNVFAPTNEITYTGAYSPYGIPNMPYEARKGVIKASGSILKANLDGTQLELVAWGFRHIPALKFDHNDNLCATNQGYNIRGSRPIANAQDEFHYITPGIWYGWPDYVGDEPITQKRFQPEGATQPTFLFTNPPNIPPKPFAIFAASSTVMGFAINYNVEFGPVGDIYVAELGNMWSRSPRDNTPYIGTGHKISKIDATSGEVTTFVINKSGFPYVLSGEGAFGRPIDVVFGPDGAMYVLDIGISIKDQFNIFIPHTGVIWKITRE